MKKPIAVVVVWVLLGALAGGAALADNVGGSAELAGGVLVGNIPERVGANVATLGDVGASVTDAMSRPAPEGLLGIHTNLLVTALAIADAPPPYPVYAPPPDPQDDK